MLPLIPLRPVWAWAAAGEYGEELLTPPDADADADAPADANTDADAGAIVGR